MNTVFTAFREMREAGVRQQTGVGPLDLWAAITLFCSLDLLLLCSFYLNLMFIQVGHKDLPPSRSA